MVGAMVPTAPGLALTRSRGSRDSGLRLRAAAPALGTRRRHRHRQRDETSRMPTSGATRRTELGRSLKSSLKGRAGQGKAWGCSPPPPPRLLPAPSPTPPGYPYLVTPMCRARTSQVLPAGKQGGAELGRPHAGRLPAHPERAASPRGGRPTSTGPRMGSVPTAEATKRAPWHGTSCPRCWARGWDLAEPQQPPSPQKDGIPAPARHHLGGPAPEHRREGVKPGRAEVQGGEGRGGHPHGRVPWHPVLTAGPQQLVQDRQRVQAYLENEVGKEEEDAGPQQSLEEAASVTCETRAPYYPSPKVTPECTSTPRGRVEEGCAAAVPGDARGLPQGRGPTKTSHLPPSTA